MKTYFRLSILFYLLALNTLNAQIKSIDSLKLYDNTIDWKVDELGYYYLLTENEIQKIDTTKNLVFSQSIKSLGKIDQIEFINAQNILLFSVEQQQIFLLDNTLTSNGYEISLEDFGILNAKFISRSSRPNLVWIYDQINSKILLFDLYKKSIIQEVYNFKGLFGIREEIEHFYENNNNLIVGSNSMTYILDLNINLIQTLPEILSFKDFIYEDLFIQLEDTEIIITNLISQEKNKISTPFERIEKALISNNHFYICANRIIYKVFIK